VTRRDGYLGAAARALLDELRRGVLPEPDGNRDEPAAHT
jgi:hypothetical protein